MPTTEEILTDLTVQRQAHAAAGDIAAVARVEQQISAQQALAGLRAEQAALRAAGDTAAAVALDTLVGYWRRQIDVDPAEPADPPPADGPPARARRGR